MALFYRLYDHLLVYQEESTVHVAKGMPLVWVSDCHANLDHPALAKRYLMLTLCEDVIRDNGQFRPDVSGAYLHLVWRYGLSHEEVVRYANQIWNLYQEHNREGLYPEWVLQDLDDAWMIEHRSVRESSLYFVNIRYIRLLQKTLGSQQGRTLERLAHYLLTGIPGCRAKMRVWSQSTEYDVMGALEGQDIDFRSQDPAREWAMPRSKQARH